MRVTSVLTTALLAGSLSIVQGAMVQVDPSVEYQTMEGFGVYFQNGAIPDYVVTELGATVVRTDILLDQASWTGRISSVRETKAVFDRLGEPVRFLASCWTPPVHMKDLSRDVSSTCSSEPGTCGGHLRPEFYDDFGAHVRDYVTATEQQAGVEFFGISLQNEPAFIEPYWSCVYTATEYRDMVKAAGPVVHAAHPDVRLFGAEDVLDRWNVPGAFGGPLMADAEAKAQVHALAVHGYTDGVHPTLTSGAATKWSQAARNCASAGKPLWMTETSGYATDWNGALQLAEAIYSALKYGKISLWNWWQLDQLSGNGSKPKLYWAARNFYRWIRPGAVMVNAVSSDSLVFAVAFHHKTNRTLSVVLINGNSSARDISVTGTDLPAQFRRYVSSASLNCADQGLVTSDATVTLPASSVTTLYGDGYAPSVGVTRPDVHGRWRVRSTGNTPSRHVETYTLRGERLSPSVGSAAGVSVRRASFPNGAVVISPMSNGR